MKHLFRFSLLLLALLLPAAAAAHDFEVGGIYYNINGDEATVTFRGTYTHSYSDEYTAVQSPIAAPLTLSPPSERVPSCSVTK